MQLPAAKHPNVKTFLSRYANNSIYLAVPEKHSRFGSYCFTGGMRFIPCNTHIGGTRQSPKQMNTRMIKEALRYKFELGHSLERTAMALKISKGVVAKYVDLSKAAGLDWSQVEAMTEAQLQARLLPGRHVLKQQQESMKSLYRHGASQTVERGLIGATDFGHCTHQHAAADQFACFHFLFFG